MPHGTTQCYLSPGRGDIPAHSRCRSMTTNTLYLAKSVEELMRSCEPMPFSIPQTTVPDWESEKVATLPGRELLHSSMLHYNKSVFSFLRRLTT